MFSANKWFLIDIFILIIQLEFFAIKNSKK
jgi:hypothetical protein